MMTNDKVVRLDAKLASIARTGRTAMVCFYVRVIDDGDLGKLAAVRDSDLLLGIVIADDTDPPPE